MGRMARESDVIPLILENDGDSFRLLAERYAGPVTRTIRDVSADNQVRANIAQEEEARLRA